VNKNDRTFWYLFLVLSFMRHHLKTDWQVRVMGLIFVIGICPKGANQIIRDTFLPIFAPVPTPGPTPRPVWRNIFHFPNNNSFLVYKQLETGNYSSKNGLKMSHDTWLTPSLSLEHFLVTLAVSRIIFMAPKYRFLRVEIPVLQENLCKPPKNDNKNGLEIRFKIFSKAKMHPIDTLSFFQLNVIKFLDCGLCYHI